MILNALVKRYEDTAEVKPGWQKRDVSYSLNIAEDGHLLGIVPLGDHSGKKPGKLLLTLPSIGSGRTGSKAYETAYFLCDDGGYMLGIDEKKFASARKLHTELLENINDSAAKAITAYFNAGIPDLPKDSCIDAKDAVTAKFVFQVNGKRIDYDDGCAEIRHAWESAQRSREPQEQGLCLVTGKRDVIIRLHHKVALPGVTMSNQPLISMNDQTSFRSYGKTTDDPPAEIGAKTAFAYATALNDLLKSDKNHRSLGGDTLVYWAEGKGEKEEEVFSWSMNPSESNGDKLSAIVDKVARGEHSDIDGCEWEKPFYLLCLSPNAARISVRFFYTSQFGNIIENVAKHYKNLEIYSSRNEKFRLLPPWILLSETTVSGKTSDALPLLGGQLMRSIVSGEPYALTLYNAIVTRARIKGEVNRAKAAVIKAVLTRNYYKGEVPAMSLNESSSNIPYALGRLFSVLERLQERANGSATIRERFFASACANPRSVFPTLLKLSIHHSAKLENAVFYEKLKTELLGKLDDAAPFPAALNLENQGRFILGYYHQTQDFFTSKKEKEENKNV